MEEKVPVKKRVGRPKKNTQESSDALKTTNDKTESPKTTTSTTSAGVPITQKKRGRKPKALTETLENNTVKIPSKKGENLKKNQKRR